MRKQQLIVSNFALCCFARRRYFFSAAFVQSSRDTQLQKGLNGRVWHVGDIFIYYGPEKENHVELAKMHRRTVRTANQISFASRKRTKYQHMDA